MSGANAGVYIYGSIPPFIALATTTNDVQSTTRAKLFSINGAPQLKICPIKHAFSVKENFVFYNILEIVHLGKATMFLNLIRSGIPNLSVGKELIKTIRPYSTVRL